MSFCPTINRQAHATIPAEQLDALEALTLAVWDVEAEYPRYNLDGPRFTFRKREYGGYFVEAEGLRIGWVVKHVEHARGGLYDRTETSWVGVTYDPSQPKGTRYVTQGASTRKDAAEALAASVTRYDRFEYLWHLEEQECDRKRWAALGL